MTCSINETRFLSKQDSNSKRHSRNELQVLPDANLKEKHTPAQGMSRLSGVEGLQGSTQHVDVSKVDKN